MESATSMKQSCHDDDGSTALVHLFSRVTFNGCVWVKEDGEDGLSMPKHQEIAICMHSDVFLRTCMHRVELTAVALNRPVLGGVERNDSSN